MMMGVASRLSRIVLSELVKAFNRRTAVVASVAVASAVALSYVTKTLAEGLSILDANDTLVAVGGLGAALGLPAVPVWIIALGPVLAWVDEFRADSIAVSVATVSRQWRLWVCKWIVWTSVSAGLGVICTLAAFVPLLGEVGTSTFFSRDAAMVLGSNALFALFVANVAFGITFVARDGSVAAAALYLTAWAVEPFLMLSAIYVPALQSWAHYVRYLPLRALSQVQYSSAIGTSVTEFPLAQHVAIEEGIIVTLVVGVISLGTAVVRSPL